MMVGSEVTFVELVKYEYKRFIDDLGNVTQCDPTGLRPLITLRFNTIDGEIDLSSYRLSKE